MTLIAEPCPSTIVNNCKQLARATSLEIEPVVTRFTSLEQFIYAKPRTDFECKERSLYLVWSCTWQIIRLNFTGSREGGGKSSPAALHNMAD